MCVLLCVEPLSEIRPYAHGEVQSVKGAVVAAAADVYVAPVERRNDINIRRHRLNWWARIRRCLELFLIGRECGPQRTLDTWIATLA